MSGRAGEPRRDAPRAGAGAAGEPPEALAFAFDERLRFLWTAGRAPARTGDADSSRPGRALAEALPASLWGTLEPLLRSALAGETRSREIWTAAEERCLAVDVGPLREGGVALALDVTARRRAELLAGEERAWGRGELLGVGRPQLGTGLLDGEGRWLLANRALCDITGYTAAELAGRRFEAIVHPEDAHEPGEQRGRLLAGEILVSHAEQRCFDAGGETVSAIVSTSLLRGHGGAGAVYAVQLRDVSERWLLEQEVLGLGDHDPLTGLRNRRLFAHDLAQQLARCRRYGEIGGLLLIEVDAFARAAERHGEDAAERAQEAVARALVRRLRETDLVASMGVDRFAVLLPHIDEEGLAVVAEGLERAIAACGVDVGDEVLHPCARIGCARVDERAGSAEQVLEHAGRTLRAGWRLRGAPAG